MCGSKRTQEVVARGCLARGGNSALLTDLRQDHVTFLAAVTRNLTVYDPHYRIGWLLGAAVAALTRVRVRPQTGRQLGGTAARGAPARCGGVC